MNGEKERYRLVRPLATGGMAELFLGVARGAGGFEKPVAIKRVLPHLAQEPTVAQMFLAEAKLATHLQHQNIASVYDVGTGPGGLFLVMELVDGWDLGVLLRRAFRREQRFPPHLVAFIGAQVLAGLVHAYRRMHGGRPVMTAHRDISPSNILVSREGEVKVTDFGIARLEGTSMGTQPGTFKGKVPYSSPETIQGKPATAASDQFSLGIVLYELLTGQHPFGGANADPLSYAWTIPQNEPPPLPPEIPAPLGAMVMRALAKAPEARFPRPEDMAEALARYLAQAGEPATSQSLADYLASLNLPPTLLELSEQAERDGEPLETLEPTVRRPSVATRPVEPVSFDLQDTGTWDAQPGGPALSMSGRLTMPTAPTTPRCIRCNAPLPSAHAPCDRCARELAPGLSSLAEDPSADPHSEASPPPESSSPEPHPVLDMPAESLELAERGPRPPPEETHYSAYTEPVAPRRRWLIPVAVTTLLLLVLVGGIVAVLPHLGRLRASIPFPGGAVSAPMLSIQSEPEGATVSVDGTVLGTTPLFIDNTFPQRDIPVQVTLEGYKPWTGTFTGGRPASLEMRLRRARR